MTELLEGAFRALGSAPSDRELRLVAKTLRQSGDEETVELLEDAVDTMGDRDDRLAWDEVLEIAERTEVYGFVALELVCHFGNPNFGPRRSGPLPSP